LRDVLRDALNADKAKGPKWDGRMNVWIPWEATATSECPVPEGVKGKYKLSDGDIDENYILSFMLWDSSADKGRDISAYMVTSIREQGA
jgi:hypothetical protein